MNDKIDTDIKIFKFAISNYESTLNYYHERLRKAKLPSDITNIKGGIYRITNALEDKKKELYNLEHPHQMTFNFDENKKAI